MWELIIMTQIDITVIELNRNGISLQKSLNNVWQSHWINVSPAAAAHFEALTLFWDTSGNQTLVFSLFRGCVSTESRVRSLLVSIISKVEHGLTEAAENSLFPGLFSRCFTLQNPQCDMWVSRLLAVCWSVCLHTGGGRTSLSISLTSLLSCVLSLHSYIWASALWGQQGR